MIHQKLNPYFAILFLTLIGSATAFWLVWQSNAMEIEDSLPVVVQHQIPHTTANRIDTSTWKTYRNEQYGFEFQYPQEWVLCDLNSEPLCASKMPDYMLGITYSPYSLAAPAPSYCQVTEDKPRCEKYTLDGTTAIIDWEWAKGAWIRYMEKGIDIDLTPRNTDELHKKQFRQLLSTFTFTK